MMLMPCASTAYMKMFDRTRSQYGLSTAGPAIRISAPAAMTKIDSAFLLCAAAAETVCERAPDTGSDLGIGEIAIAEEPARAEQQNEQEDEEAHRIAIARRQQAGNDVLCDAKNDSGDNRPVHAAKAPQHDDDERLHREAVAGDRRKRVEHRNQRARGPRHRSADAKGDRVDTARV